MFDALDSLAVRGINRVGRSLAVLVWVVLLLVAAAAYVRPATSTTALGVDYARLSRHPWALLHNTDKSADPLSVGVEHRLLTPVISYLLGLRGERIIITNLLAAAALLGCVMVWFARRSLRPGDALFAAAVLAFSLVTLTTVYYGGYCDSITYLIVFLMVWARSRPVTFYTLFLLGLLNHESIAFLAPWFCYVTWNSRSGRGAWVLSTVVGMVAVFAAYAVYRSVLTAHGAAGSIDAYLAPLHVDPWHWLRRSWPYQFVGLFSVFKLVWAIPFVVVASMWRRGQRHQAVEVVLPVACASLQFVVAYDSSRLFTLGFMTMVLSLAFAFRENPFGFRRWAVPLFLVNLLVPQIFTAARVVEVMVPTLVRVIQRF